MSKMRGNWTKRITMMQAQSPMPHPEPKETLAKALDRAGEELGLSRTEVSELIGRSRKVLERGIEPGTKHGELAVLVVRVYRNLYTLFGGDQKAMRHWLHSANEDLGGPPIEMVRTVQGLVEVVSYLDAMRGKA